MKKAKELENSLYDFNAHDDEFKNKTKKKSKISKKNKSINTEKKSTNKFDFSNEIVIGLPRLEDGKENKKLRKNNKKKVKNTSNSNKKKDKKVEKTKIKNTDKNKEKKTVKKNKKLKINKKNINRNANININEQDIILETSQPINNKGSTKKSKILKYSFLVICILIVIIATMMSPLFDIKEILVEGNEKLTRDEIISLSQININSNTYRTNMSKSKKKILENPYVENVTIRRIIPDKVSIKIEERKTTFMIEYGGGYAYINNQGYILEISNEKLEVPIIQGAETLTDDFIAGKRLCAEDLNKMSTVIKIMEMAENNEIANLITRIDIANKQNYKVVFESEQKVAYIGDDTDLNTKILSIKSILEREKAVAGEIFVNMDLKSNYPTFRQSV